MNYTREELRDLEYLRQSIEVWSHVKRIINLVPAFGRYRYQIEIRQTPEFVIGNCDRDMLDVVIEHRCGQIENSNAAWLGGLERGQRQAEGPRVIDIEATVVEDKP